MTVWLRLAALALIVAALGLPVNDVYRYALMVLAAVPLFAGNISSRPAAWLAAIALAALAMLGQMLLAAPRIDEGHNVFIVESRGGALERGLPADAFRQMLAEFDARYPRERRCDPRTPGCWRGQGFPDRAFAFSADGIYDAAPLSRRVTGIAFSDPVWLRLGFINETQYNWYGASDVQRNTRERRWWMVSHPWRLDMPYFTMHRFPADFAGSRLCWRGLVLWEGAEQRFAPQRHAGLECRTLAAADAGRMIFGVSIAEPLAMTLEPTDPIRWRRLAEPGVALLGVLAVLVLLVGWRPQRMALPLTLIGLALIVVLLNDASFIGGVRPFDGGDDGLFYEGQGRRIVQHLLAGDLVRALQGGEAVYYYGGPGLRYVRALEHFAFGDTFLGYLTLMLLLPLLVFAVFRRFFSARAALALMLMFVAVPVGAVFGTTYFQYVKWAARGFADPAAAVAFLAGFVVLIGRTASGPDGRFAPALAAGFLFALALWLRPNLAPGAAVLLGGAGLAALWQLQVARLAGLCIGFAPVFGMALHNWIFGGVFVLFSSNAVLPEALPMPPAAYAAAYEELLRSDFAGEHLRRAAAQLARWLAGPSESVIMVPLHALAVVVLVRVAIWRGRFDPWLRLAAVATIALHAVAFFYLIADRYYLLSWFLTLLVCAVWMRDEGIDLLRRLCPRAMAWLARHPARRALARVLDRWASATGVATPRTPG